MVGLNQHRYELTSAQLAAVLDAAGVDPGAVTGTQPIEAASYNTVYRIRLRGSEGGGGLVLKVAPDPAAPGLSHEHELLRTEALFHRLAAPAMPVPDVVRADFGRTLLPTDLLLTTELPGESWHTQRHRITGERHTRLRATLGEMVAALHKTTGTAFGYPQGPVHPDWRTAFLSMMDAVLTDAEYWKTTLPLPSNELRALVDAHAETLAEVTTPVLVHFDLWPGNILVEGDTITGVVDGERAFWGDPLADLVSPSLFGDLDEAFLAGYGGGPATPAEHARLALYRLYLYVIMLVEGAPRGYRGPERVALERLIGRHLVAAAGPLR